MNDQKTDFDSGGEDHSVKAYNAERSFELSLLEEVENEESVEFEDLLAALMRERMAEIMAIDTSADNEVILPILEKTFNTTIGLLEDHTIFRDLSNEMIKNVHTILQKLLECMDNHDKEFKSYVRKNTLLIQKNLEQAVKRRLPELNPPELPPIRAPKEAKLAPNKVTIYAEGLTKFIWDRLYPLFVFDHKRDEPLPFFLSPTFCRDFVKQFHEHLLPWLLKKEEIQEIIKNIPDDKNSQDEYLRQKFLHQGVNHTKAHWERGFTRLAKNPEAKNPFSRAWQNISKKPKRNDYQPPEAKDHPMFHTIFERRLGAVRQKIIGLQQVVEQESTSDGRKGSTRDYLCNTSRSLPIDGDLITVWTYYAYPNLFSETMQSEFFRSMGKSDQERRRYIPFFIRYTINNKDK